VFIHKNPATAATGTKKDESSAMNYEYSLKIWHFLKECPHVGLQEDINKGSGSDREERTIPIQVFA